MPTRHGLWPRRVRNCHRRLLRGARLQDPGSDGLSQQGHRRRRRQRRRRVHHQGVRVKLRHGRAPVHSQNRRVRPGRLIMHACMIRPIHQSNINLLSASMCMGGRFHLARPTTTIPSSATGSPLSRGSCAPRRSQPGAAKRGSAQRRSAAGGGGGGGGAQCNGCTPAVAVDRGALREAPKQSTRATVRGDGVCTPRIWVC